MIHYCCNAHAEAVSSLWYLLPDRLQRLDHVVARDLGDRPLVQRLGIFTQRHRPLRLVLPIAERLLLHRYLHRKASRESVSLDDSKDPLFIAFSSASFVIVGVGIVQPAWLAFHVGGSGLVGLVLLSSSVAGLVLAPVAGHLVDRHDGAKN
ncbi:hypothetical protein [Mesorhizobium sp. M0435]|uniref:hypothetical protein n=1 Tax=Mesorhizobium sp. M0435 TaxID=2956944 RepID=UPI003339B2DA